MSSPLTCFQVPVHTVAHIYNHRETEPQPPYPNDQFGSPLADSMSPSDTDSYTHTDHYDQVGYNRVPSALGSVKFEDPEEGLRYTHENMNDYASPQLLCPRPTLPSSQLSPQASWYDWPSQAPANAYQVYSEPSTSQPERYPNSISHPSHAPEMQHSFESQQFVPKFYPAAQEFGETIASPLTSNHFNDAGYIQHLFSTSMSPFERGPTQLTHSVDIQPRFYAAHQPVRPEQRSSYSELAPNLKFMNGQTQPSLVRHEPIKIQESSIPKRAIITKTPSLDPKENPFALGLNGPPLTAIGRKVPLPAPLPIPLNPTNPTNFSGCAPLPLNSPTAPTTSPTTSSTPPPKSSSKTGKTRSSSSRSVNEPRRPSLACTFCRERKIACGRPPNGSPDPTCNQCARRSFRCRYLDLKSTSRASSKGSSSSLKRK